VSAVPPDPEVNWNDPVLIEAAGRSPDAIRALLRKYGQPAPTVESIYQWPSRGHVPAQWRPGLVYALLRENRIKVQQLFRRVAAPADDPARG
jgi:hypothetical protein